MLGWFALWIAGINLGLDQYCILTGMGSLMVLLGRPAWREYVGYDFRAGQG